MHDLVSSGHVAQALGISLSYLRKLERTGITPPAQRVAGLDRRIYRREEIEDIRRLLAERRKNGRPDRPAA